MPDRSGSRRALSISLALTVAFGLAQVVAGIVFNSLALLADAVHNVSDGAAIGLALAAVWAAGLPAAGRRTYGWRRAEILAALVNGLALVVVGGWILYEAVRRFENPPDVAGGGVLVVGLLGIVANGIPVMLMLRAGTANDLNLRGAMLHALGDTLGSAGTAVAGLVVLTTGWNAADPLVGGLIGLLVVFTAWTLIRDSLRILMEVAPADCDPQEIGHALADADGVLQVHDLHIWTITSGFPSLSAHIVANTDADHDRLLHELEHLLAARFGITHTTLQIDRDHGQGLLQIHRPGCEQAPVRRTGPVRSGHEH
jgi:cobalt-zinc-cadmium efflux system protein